MLTPIVASFNTDNVALSTLYAQPVGFVLDERFVDIQDAYLNIYCSIYTDGAFTGKPTLANTSSFTIYPSAKIWVLEGPYAGGWPLALTNTYYVTWSNGGICTAGVTKIQLKNRQVTSDAGVILDDASLLLRSTCKIDIVWTYDSLAPKALGAGVSNANVLALQYQTTNPLVIISKYLG